MPCIQRQMYNVCMYVIAWSRVYKRDCTKRLPYSFLLASYPGHSQFFNQRATLKNWEWPGYEATFLYHTVHMHTDTGTLLCKHVSVAVWSP